MVRRDDDCEPLSPAVDQRIADASRATMAPDLNGRHWGMEAVTELDDGRLLRLHVADIVDGYGGASPNGQSVCHLASAGRDDCPCPESRIFGRGANEYPSRRATGDTTSPAARSPSRPVSSRIA